MTAQQPRFADGSIATAAELDAIARALFYPSASSMERELRAADERRSVRKAGR